MHALCRIHVAFACIFALDPVTVLFTCTVIYRELVCILHALLVLTVKQKHSETCTSQKNRIEPPVKELKLKLSPKSLCYCSPAVCTPRACEFRSDSKLLKVTSYSS